MWTSTAHLWGERYKQYGRTQIAHGPERKQDSLFQCWGVKRIRVAVTVFIVFNVLVLLLINSGGRNGSLSSGFKPEPCDNCHIGSPTYRDIRKDIFHLPLLQDVDMSRYYFPVKTAWCYTNGSSVKQSQDAGPCVCKPNFFGKDCGIPQIIWSSNFLEEGKKLGVWVKRRKRPRRLINVITVTNASQFDFLRLQLDYLGAIVECFVIGYEGSSDLFSRIKEEFEIAPKLLLDKPGSLWYFVPFALADAHDCRLLGFEPWSDSPLRQTGDRSSSDCDSSGDDIDCEGTACAGSRHRYTNPTTSRARASPDHQPPEPDRLGHTGWCTCGRCVPMPTDLESVCCREVPAATRKQPSDCLTTHPHFHTLCLDEVVLDVAIHMLQDNGIRC
ncbi:hypothetical protein HPB47_025697 [Ixodes persulcatus]|uniref:Uncharacterized protein n=1 Tax=Ixodes persulcatus TaxID=34615 RepID=A0AC60Q1F0_IXOPE|nr:hypothetical protein HPB47_025697 [Ixodes persulcatus]